MPRNKLFKIEHFLLIISLFLTGVIVWIKPKPADFSVVRGPYAVNRITVIDGDEFDITTKDSRLHGKLRKTTPPEATVKVIRLLNEIEKPRVLLLENQGDFWYVDLLIVSQGTEMTLTDWLKSNGLLFTTG